MQRLRPFKHLIPLILIVTGCQQHLQRNQTVDFLPGWGHYSAEENRWRIHVHGWIYEDSWLVRNYAILTSAISLEDMVDEQEDRELLRQRMLPFLVSNKSKKKLQVLVNDQLYRLSSSTKNGQINTTLHLSADGVDRHQTNWIRYQLLMAPGDERTFSGQAQLLADEGLLILSDIDDTIKITDVHNTKEMIKNTFVRDFQPVPGMAERYTAWQREHDADFHYLSASPVELNEPLSAFLEQAGFPKGSMELNTVNWEGGPFEIVMNLFSVPPEYKRSAIERLVQALPRRQYVLIGDSSQDDPEVYGEIYRRYPEQVLRILIRDVTCCVEADDPRYQEAFKDVPSENWQLFRDPTELELNLDPAEEQR